MTANEVFRPGLFDNNYSIQLHSQFCTNQPVRHLVIDNFLQPAFANSIFENFPPMKEMNTHYKGINEKKAEHSKLENLDSSFQQLHNALGSPEFIQWLEKITGIDTLSTLKTGWAMVFTRVPMAVSLISILIITCTLLKKCFAN
jgi:hypothetical protein